MPARLKIVFLAWRDLANPLAGGSEVLIDRLASGLTTRGHDVTLVAGGPVADRLYRVVAAGGRYDQYLRAPAIVERQFRDADLVVDVANGMSYLTPLWRRRPSVCLVNHVHTDQWGLWFGPPLAAVGRTLERSVTPRVYHHRLFVAVSQSTADALAGIGVDRDQIRIVPNGVDLQSPTAPKSPTPTFVALGRLVPHKRIDLLLETWARVYPRTGGELIIVGDGPEAPRLRAMAGPGVRFAGQVDEATKQRLLSAAWLLVHPSMLEGWGLVVTEAAAVGTPTLAFDVPGLRDSVADGLSGVLVNDAAALAEQWTALTSDTRRRNQLAAGARRRAAAFSWDNTVDRFLEVGEEAVARARAPRRRPAVTAPVLVNAPPAPAARSTSAIDVSVIVPACNEAHRLPESLPRLLDALRGLDSELIVVDDGSTDGTSEVAAGLLRRVPNASLVQLPARQGKGAAVRAGVATATGRRVVFVDADLSTDLDDLAALLDALDRAHVAIGSRAAPGGVVTGATQTHKVVGRLFNHWARAITGTDIGDFRCGFKAFRASAAKVLFGLSEVDGFAFDVEVLGLAQRIGYRTVEVPVRWHAVDAEPRHLLRHAPPIAASMVQSRLRWTGHRSVAAIRAARSYGTDAIELATALSGLVSAPGPVVPWHDGVLALLPFYDDARAARLAVQAQEQLPEFEIHSHRLAARRLLAPSEHDLRNAIAAA